jgi:SAM-dependent methyltransferase
MASWQDGYITDIPYTAGFFRELAPPYLHLLSLLMGVRPVPIGQRGFSYCELGSGQGLGTLIAAASNPLGRFVGVDFNPAQIAKANDLAARAGLGNVAFHEESFASLAAKGEADGSKFDMVVLHGIYSWISAENQRHIVEIIRSRLKPGGIVYVSYNCMPGWAAFAPVQRLMREFASRRPGRSDQNVLAALAFVNELGAKGARYFKPNEPVARNLARMAEKDRTYLAHEYLNEHWEALYHIDVARQMSDARLEYVGSATISDNVIALTAPPEIAAMLPSGDPAMAETIKDFTANRQFRRDLYVRGPVRLTGQQFVHELGAVRFTLTIAPERATLKLATAAGELKSNALLVEPLLARLKQGSASFAELAALPEMRAMQGWQVAQALSLLVESGQIHPLLESGDAEPEAAQTLNATLLEAARHDESMQFLAAPAIGSGVYVANAEQLVLLGMKSLGNRDDVAALARFVWPIFKAQNRRMKKDGGVIEDEAENVAELERRIAEFLRERYPILRKLKVVA